MKRTGCHQEQTRVGVPNATPASSRRTRRTGHIGPLGSNPSPREAAKQNQQWEKVQWGRGWGPGETGPSFQNPVPRTHNGPPETRAPREACHRLRAGVLTGGPALQVPLLGRHSIQPQGGGCEHRKSTGAQGAPICGGAGGPPDTPAPRRQLCTWASWRTAVRPAGRASLYTTAWPQVWLRPPGPWLSTQLPAQETGLWRLRKEPPK